VKVIETEWNGYKFRSRLEARWAVFFDNVGIEYRYEPEGFDIDGIWYLPDFYLPKHSCWVEIKPGDPSQEEMVKAAALGYSQGPAYIFHGEVWLNGYDTLQFTNDPVESPIDERLKTIILETVEKWGQEFIEMEVMPDHVHLLVGCDPQFGIHRLVKYIKGASSRSLRQEFPQLKRRLPSLWTNSYFVASVGGVTLETLKRYVEGQKDR